MLCPTHKISDRLDPSVLASRQNSYPRCDPVPVVIHSRRYSFPSLFIPVVIHSRRYSLPVVIHFPSLFTSRRYSLPVLLHLPSFCTSRPFAPPVLLHLPSFFTSRLFSRPVLIHFPSLFISRRNSFSRRLAFEFVEQQPPAAAGDRHRVAVCEQDLAGAVGERLGFFHRVETDDRVS